MSEDMISELVTLLFVEPPVYIGSVKQRMVNMDVSILVIQNFLSISVTYHDV